MINAQTDCQDREDVEKQDSEKVALIAVGTDLYGLNDSPAATATSSTPPKEYNA